MTQILLTNDDGIEAEGLRRLEKALEGLADIVVVAPDRERSAVSHGLTIDRPLSFTTISENRHTLNGTPADCVIYSLRRLLPVPPVLIISGINHGANLGDDIMYSGTVAAAREASHRGVAALAVSQAYDQRPIRFDGGIKYIRLLVKSMLEEGADGGICLNVNIPVGRIRGAKVTRQGCAYHFPHFNSLGMKDSPVDLLDEPEDGSKKKIPLDFQAILEGYVSITPLQRDQTDYSTMSVLNTEISRIFRGLRIPGIGLIRQGN